MLHLRRSISTTRSYHAIQGFSCRKILWFRVYQQRFIAEFSHSHHDSKLSILSTTVDTASAEFKENAEQMNNVLATLGKLHSKIEIGGPSKARDKHISRGKILPREYSKRDQNRPRNLLNLNLVE